MSFSEEEIWKALGLEPTNTYQCTAREKALRAKDYYVYPISRQTGRTTHSAVLAVKALSEGRKVLLVAGVHKQAQMFADRVVSYAKVCNLGLTHIDYCTVTEFVEGRFDPKLDTAIFDHTAKEAC